MTNIDLLTPTLEKMAELGILLLIHGEVTAKHVDIFDREAEFIETKLKPLVMKVPNLKIVLEHCTTKQAVDFVMAAPDHVGATITPQHLLYNRNAIFDGGLRPHMYCLPILKREEHRKALLGAVSSGSPKFFLGTDSAPHAKGDKESACGCAGCFLHTPQLSYMQKLLKVWVAWTSWKLLLVSMGPLSMAKRSTQRKCAWRKSLDYSVCCSVWRKSCGSIKSWDIIKIQAQYRLSDEAVESLCIYI